MAAPVKPGDENARLAALYALGILDTPPEQRFDRLTRLARRLLDAPTAMVSLIDEDRQWFKSADGLGADELPRDISFCGHAILDDDILYVPDALEDERFRDNPLVRGEPGIRFYAGCPLRSRAGYKLGSFCILDYRPRTLDIDALQDLRDLAAIAEREFHAHELAATDELTGLPNRRGFMAMAEQALQLCIRRGLPVSLLYLDLDDFKSLNDVHGHAAGDAVLCEFAEALTSSLRASDPRGRLGGDEFAVLLIGDPEAFVERLQATPVTAELQWAAGVVGFDPDRHAVIEDLLQEADQCMYRNKRSRKDERPAPPDAG